MEKLPSKGKHTVKVGNHVHTNVILKPAIVKLKHKWRILEIHKKLKDQQLKIFLFICRLLYQNLMVTNQNYIIANQKSTIDAHTKRKNNPNISLNLVIKLQKKKRTKEEGKKKKAYENKSKTINKMAVRIYILIITLNVNRLTVATKRHRLESGYQKGPIYVYKRPTSDLGTHTD